MHASPVTVRSKFSTNSASVQGANIEAISTVCKIIRVNYETAEPKSFMSPLSDFSQLEKIKSFSKPVLVFSMEVKTSLFFKRGISLYSRLTMCVLRRIRFYIRCSYFYCQPQIYTYWWHSQMTAFQYTSRIFNNKFLILIDAASVISGSSTSATLFDGHSSQNPTTVSNSSIIDTTRNPPDPGIEQLFMCKSAPVTVIWRMSTNWWDNPVNKLCSIDQIEMIQWSNNCRNWALLNDFALACQHRWLKSVQQEMHLWQITKLW